jgi:hypothetical protein
VKTGRWQHKYEKRDFIGHPHPASTGEPLKAGATMGKKQIFYNLLGQTW